MGFSRNMPMGATIDPDMIAAIASDPEGFKSRKQELIAAYDAACAAADEAKARRQDLNDKENALNEREADLVASHNALDKKTAALADRIAAFDAEASKKAAGLAERGTVLAVRAVDLDARELRVAKNETESTAALRSAVADSAAAALKLAKIKEIVVGLEGLKEKLSSIEN